MLRALLLGTGAALAFGVAAAAHDDPGGFQSPPWSRSYSEQASAARMWSSWSREERWSREVEVYEHGTYGYAYESDHRRAPDCRCRPAPRLRPVEVHVRPGPIYMDRRPVYIDQPPVHVRQPPIHVASPPIYVEGPPVYVESPPVYVDAPVVHVTPGPVHVAPPEVHVRAAETLHEAPPPPPPPPPPATHFGDLPPPGNIPPTAPPPSHNYRQEPGERG